MWGHHFEQERMRTGTNRVFGGEGGRRRAKFLTTCTLLQVVSSLLRQLLLRPGSGLREGEAGEGQDRLGTDQTRRATLTIIKQGETFAC